MVPVKMMHEILDLKSKGFSPNEIFEYLKDRYPKSPTKRTILKYYNMDSVPDNPGAALEKDKAFDREPFRGTILRVMETLPKGYFISSVYDVLMEKFVESGEYRSLPGNQQTLRNYIHHLRETGQIPPEDNSGKRTYEFVMDTPPGEQMLIDFGEVRTEGGNGKIHFICLLLRYSRYLYVLAQDHKFNSKEACRAIYWCFCKIGGRPNTLVIDQDAVFVNSETYGEVVETETFRQFCQEQELHLWVCHKADPESKGPIENSVKFVKTSFFSARRITCLADVTKSLPGWLERQNKRIHQSTYMVPAIVFEEYERKALRQNIPSVFETSELSFIECHLGNQAFVLYRTVKYWIDSSYCFSTVYYKVAGSMIHIYDKDRNLIRSHYLTEQKGANVQCPEDRRDNSDRWVEVVERLRSKWNCLDFQHFINGFKKENPRHLYAQLRAVENYLEQQKPSRKVTAEVLSECCRNYRYRFSQFKAVLDRQMQLDGFKESLLDVPRKPVADVHHHDFDFYGEAFSKRCAQEA